jgi:hypothetical protein
MRLQSVGSLERFLTFEGHVFAAEPVCWATSKAPQLG